MPIEKTPGQPASSFDSIPSTYEGLIDLQGEPQAVREAEKLRLILWTDVVHWLARESGLGSSLVKVSLMRDKARAEINEQVYAVWWLQWRKLLMGPGSILDGEEEVRHVREPVAGHALNGTVDGDGPEEGEGGRWAEVVR